MALAAIVAAGVVGVLSLPTAWDKRAMIAAAYIAISVCIFVLGRLRSVL